MTQALLIDVPSTRQSAESDHWFTPSRIFDPLQAEFNFTLDPCAHPESRKAPTSWTVEQDGLARSWAHHRAFCNPPYSDIRPWVEKANREICAKPAAQLIAMLLPAWTDRAWWHDLIEPYRDGNTPNQWFGEIPRIETRFIRGRVRFGSPGNPEGKGQRGGGFDPSVIIIWRGVR